MPQIDFNFTIQAEDSNSCARAGFFETSHGRTDTPAFMPVATHAVLRGIETNKLQELGYTTLLANTYHLLLKPGPEVFEHFSGIHNFMRWPNSILTDSGGFQIFSMSEHLKISEEGARFRSYVDGKYINLTPELSIQTQRSINSDIMMVLDQCIPSLSSKQQALEALNLTHRWALRSYKARADSRQAMFGIVQGACYPELRAISADQICSIDFDGFAIGGVAVGEEKNKRDEIVAYSASLLPKNKPRYVMGIGTPCDLLEAIKSGVDMFDCILPAALGQQGACFTSRGKIDIRKGIYKLKEQALDPECKCSTCKTYSTAYLHHLIKSSENVGGSLVAFHNLHFYKKLIEQARKAILNNNYLEFYNQQIGLLSASNDNKKISLKKSCGQSSQQISELGDYKVIDNREYCSIQHKLSSEVMHSTINPDQEALALYVQQSGLENKLMNAKQEFVIWDVGLGAGHNAMAALRSCLKLKKQTDTNLKIKLISFENDLDSLRLAISNKKKFRHLLHEAPAKLLLDRKWSEGNICWELIEGNFCQLFHTQQSPDIIFFDPFSYKTNSEFWSFNLLKSLYSKCSEDISELYTYSASTAFRAALMLAGFYVAKGMSTGPKSETTIALKLSSAAVKENFNYLDASWLERWKRSDNKLPADLNIDQIDTYWQILSEHKQFN